MIKKIISSIALVLFSQGLIVGNQSPYRNNAYQNMYQRQNQGQNQQQTRQTTSYQANAANSAVKSAAPQGNYLQNHNQFGGNIGAKPASPKSSENSDLFLKALMWGFGITIGITSILLPVAVVIFFLLQRFVWEPANNNNNRRTRELEREEEPVRARHRLVRGDNVMVAARE